MQVQAEAAGGGPPAAHSGFLAVASRSLEEMEWGAGDVACGGSAERVFLFARAIAVTQWRAWPCVQIGSLYLRLELILRLYNDHSRDSGDERVGTHAPSALHGCGRRRARRWTPDPKTQKVQREKVKTAELHTIVTRHLECL
eukprot:6742914-Prymnesium_polylepis.1